MAHDLRAVPLLVGRHPIHASIPCFTWGGHVEQPAVPALSADHAEYARDAKRVIPFVV